MFQYLFYKSLKLQDLYIETGADYFDEMASASRLRASILNIILSRRKVYSVVQPPRNVPVSDQWAFVNIFRPSYYVFLLGSPIRHQTKSPFCGKMFHQRPASLETSLLTEDRIPNLISTRFQRKETIERSRSRSREYSELASKHLVLVKGNE